MKPLRNKIDVQIYDQTLDRVLNQVYGQDWGIVWIKLRFKAWYKICDLVRERIEKHYETT